MNSSEFRKQAHLLVDWMADYYQNIEDYPVKPNIEPREIYDLIPDNPPEEKEAFENIFRDFEQIIMPGVTHWQSPNFFGYFPANSSFPSILAEMLTATLGLQCMKWETSPAATELEEKMMNWLKKMSGLPNYFEGVIQDSASTATLCAILAARELHSGFRINQTGYNATEHYRVYCSTETHSSIEKAVRTAGIGSLNLNKVDVDTHFRLSPQALRTAVETDLKNNNSPLCVVATLGTTGSTAIDPLKEIAQICREYSIWLHVDAAYAGSALLLPEYRQMITGIEQVDSFVFNPHKWLFTNFDCSAFFVKDKKTLLKTFRLIPEYLKTKSDNMVKNYSDWGIQLGRRFRALKLWFVIRTFGIKNMQKTLRKHISLAEKMEQNIESHPDFELLAPRSLNLLCFRYKPKSATTIEESNNINQKLLNAINESGKIFMTHTKLNNRFVLRFVCGQTYLEERHIDKAWEIISETARKISS